MRLGLRLQTLSALFQSELAKERGSGVLPAATFEITAKEKADEADSDEYCNHNECYDETFNPAFIRI